MEQSNKELIKEIADLFEDYEESYVPGEWESFQKHKKKKYPFFSPWLKIAAVLVLMASVLPFGVKKLMQNEEKTNSAGKQTTAALKKPAGQQPAELSKTKDADLPAQTQSALWKKKKSAIAPLNQTNTFDTHPVVIALAEQKTAGNENQLAVISEKPVDTAPKNQISAATQERILAQNQLKPAATEQPAQPLRDSTTIPAKAKLSTAEFLLAESKNVVKKENKKEVLSKWDFGLQVMPTATRTNMNFGGGLVTAYHISDKLSVSSGITLVQLGSGENVPGGATSMSANAAPSEFAMSAKSERRLLTVDASLKAIDIPLGLVYKVNKHYYTSAGISYFNVLNEKRYNTYSETVPVNRRSTDPSTGAMQNYTALETQEIDEVANDRPLKGNSYLGFFNFSIGRQQQIFKQYNIQIEPFIKVPIGKLSAQELNLLNSGIKFQLSF
jgi:hypothetical protein